MARNLPANPHQGVALPLAIQGKPPVGVPAGMTVSSGVNPHIQGGAMGVPSATARPANAPVQPLAHIPKLVPALKPQGPRPEEKKTQYRVVNGGYVMYDNCRTPIRAGKIVDETQYDLDLLRRQGIILEEIKQSSPKFEESGKDSIAQETP